MVEQRQRKAESCNDGKIQQNKCDLNPNTKKTRFWKEKSTEFC